MKMRIWRTLTAVVLSAVLIMAVGCSGGIGRDEAKAYVNDFLNAVESGDYETASALLHPERPMDLEKFFANLEREEWLDFSAGIEIRRYTGFSSSYYDTSVGGSVYSLDMDVTVGGTVVEMEIELVRNDGGFGIYEVDIDT